ncbi:MAG: hypothetical protein Q8P15_01060 [Nanoarchaeota archaeon]|nr:hypothetical protein [Nanoarchaeota archaeon]
MPEEKPLYEDSDLKIDYFKSPDGNKSCEDHEIQFVCSNERYILLQRGVLKELAHAKRSRLIQILDNISGHMSFKDLRRHNLTADAIGVAAHCAYIEEEKRFEEYKAKSL